MIGYWRDDDVCLCISPSLCDPVDTYTSTQLNSSLLSQKVSEEVNIKYFLRTRFYNSQLFIPFIVKFHVHLLNRMQTHTL